MAAESRGSRDGDKSLPSLLRPFPIDQAGISPKPPADSGTYVNSVRRGIRPNPIESGNLAAAL